MSLSTHYYVLSLSPRANALFEAFRDDLNEVENEGFPVLGGHPASRETDTERRRQLLRSVDRCFRHYHVRQPLKLVVVGERAMLATFRAETAHRAAMIGEVEGDHTAVAPRDLGRIVWPLVKQAMSGLLDRTMSDLKTLAGSGRVIYGLDEVARTVSKGKPSTLLVEEDYHVRGSIVEFGGRPVVSACVDIRDLIDDAVDAVIDRVLESEGNVVFVPPGCLQDRERIALLLCM